MPSGYSLQDIVARFGGEVVGDSAVKVTGIASVAHAGPGDLTFVVNARYLRSLKTSRATAAIVGQAVVGMSCIVVSNPYAYFARVATLFDTGSRPAAGVHPSASVDASAQLGLGCSVAAGAVIGRNVRLGENVVIGAACVIGDGVCIGRDSMLHPRVVVYHDCDIGARCILQSGCVIGSDGFGYAEDGGEWVKIPQVGRVILGDDVEIGANTTVDRGALDDTLIGQGAKLDNLIQIGHNCQIGAHTVIAACVGIAGSARIGQHCRIGGAAMILGHLHIADETTISPGSMITRSLEKAGTYTAIMPFQSHEQWLKTAAGIRGLGRNAKRIVALEQALAVFKKDA